MLLCTSITPQRAAGQGPLCWQLSLVSPGDALQQADRPQQAPGETPLENSQGDPPSPFAVADLSVMRSKQ